MMRLFQAICLLVLLGSFGPFTYASSLTDRLGDARAVIQRGDYATALVIYEEILQVRPRHREALLGRARVLSWMGRYEEALEDYRCVLALNPGDLEALPGTADVLAWQGHFQEAIQTLEPITARSPWNPELLVRLGRYYLWDQNRKKALYYTRALLKVRPVDPEATKLQKAARSLYTYEARTGTSYLHINNTKDGQSVYVQLLRRFNSDTALYGRIDYLHRFGRDEGRILVGGSLKLNPIFTGFMEASLAPNAEVYPTTSGWMELAWKAAPSVVLYGRGNVAHYKEADVFGGSLGLEFYPTGSLVLFFRGTLSRTHFAQGGSSLDEALLAKVTWLFDERSNFYFYFSYGNEAFRIDTIDRIGEIRAKSFGLGGTFFITPEVGLAPQAEYQDREGGIRYIQGTLEIRYRW